MRQHLLFVTLALASSVSLALGQEPTVLVSGLGGPTKLARTAAGNLLVTDTGTAIHTGRVSLVTRAGVRTTILEGLPAAATDEGVSGPTAIAVSGRTVYIAIGEGDTLAFGPTPGTQVPNPKGASSPLFSTILQLNLPVDADMSTGGFALTAENRARLADGYEVELTGTGSAKATISVLSDFRDYTPHPTKIIYGSNPFGMIIDPDDPNTIWVADAGQNAVVRVDARTGRHRIHARVTPFPVPGGGPPPVADPVLTSVRSYYGQLLVTCLSGVPFRPGLGRVLSIDKATGAIEPFINGMSAAMDIAWRPREGTTAQFFTIEFSANMSANPAPPGRLTQYDSPAGTVIAPTLITPTSMVIDPDTGDLFVTELGLGRIVVVKAR